MVSGSVVKTICAKHWTTCAHLDVEGWLLLLDLAPFDPGHIAWGS